MNSYPNICKLINTMETEGYICQTAHSVLKKHISRLKIARDIRDNDFDSVCEHIRQYLDSTEKVRDGWITKDLNEKAADLVIEVAIKEAIEGIDRKDVGEAYKLFIMINDIAVPRQSN